MPQQDKATKDAMLSAAMSVLVGMLQSRDRPQPKRIGDAVTSAMLISALGAHKSLRRAADELRIAHSTFADQLRRGLVDACNHLPMHDQLDSDLFPFIRIRWDDSSLDFVQAYFHWLSDEIQPRAHAEATKIVILQNFSPFQGQPTPEWAAALNAAVESKGDVSVVRGIVIYNPTVPDLATVLGAVHHDENSLATGGLVRFAAQPQAALDHAVQLFNTAGVDAPSLTLD